MSKQASLSLFFKKLIVVKYNENVNNGNKLILVPHTVHMDVISLKVTIL